MIWAPGSSRPLLAYAAALALACPTAAASAQEPVDSALAAYIASIRAIDGHAHPMRPVAPGAAADTDFDALPLDGIPPFSLPWRLTLDAPIWRRAQAALYHPAAGGSDSAYRASLLAAVEAAHREHGRDFPAWALDQAGIQVMLANRIAMGPGVEPPRFRWVSFTDALLFPLDTRGEATRTPDTRVLYPREAKLLARYMAELGVLTLPPTLDGYLRTVVRPLLRKQHDGGAVSIKFEAAYLRPLDFDDPDSAAARRVYGKYVRGGVPTRAEYKNLEDYLFHAVTREAGRLGMAVQIHTLEQFGGYYLTSGARPQLLEPVLQDSTLRGTKFVIVHGGWPFVGETQALLGKPNAYTDISMMDVLLGPDVLAGVLEQWLGEWPDKVLFGTDAFDGGAEQGWEQVAWVGSMTARRALALALTRMMREGEITRPRAEQLARMVLHDNAAHVYGIDTP